MEHIAWLGQPECENPKEVGGKAANLSRLAARGLVPPGFCLTTGFFGRFGSNPELSPSALVQIEKATDIAYGELSRHCNDGSSPVAVAVRSSAVAEDGEKASFAGQYETILNVIGVKDLVSAIVRCRRSAVSRRVAAYRGIRADIENDNGLAVLVQSLVPADISAVAFSVDPVGRRDDRIVITANWGLGESIVGGTVTPDTHVVRKSDLAVLKNEAGAKEKMTVMARRGTREVSVPRVMARDCAMSQSQVRETARLVKELEMAMGWPVDIECAWAKERLYLLQCRPVTSARRGQAPKGSGEIAIRSPKP